MFFYRIEDENGKGMYRNKAKEVEFGLIKPVGTFAAQLCTSVWKHNPPDCDFPDHFDLFQKRSNKAYHFGFRNLKQLYNWFDTVEAVSLLKKTGFSIVKYEIEPRYVECSDVQLIYKKGEELFVEKIDFNINDLSRKCDYSSFKEQEQALIYKFGL